MKNKKRRLISSMLILGLFTTNLVFAVDNGETEEKDVETAAMVIIDHADGSDSNNSARADFNSMGDLGAAHRVNVEIERQLPGNRAEIDRKISILYSEIDNINRIEQLIKDYESTPGRINGRRNKIAKGAKLAALREATKSDWVNERGEMPEAKEYKRNLIKNKNLAQRKIANLMQRKSRLDSLVRKGSAQPKSAYSSNLASVNNITASSKNMQVIGSKNNLGAKEATILKENSLAKPLNSSKSELVLRISKQSADLTKSKVKPVINRQAQTPNVSIEKSNGDQASNR